MKISEITNIGKSTGVAIVRDFRKILLLLSMMILLPACSGDSFTTSAITAGSGGGGTAGDAACIADSTLPGCTVTANFLSLRLSQQQVNSDGQDTTTITATVLDTSRAAVEGVQVNFSADLGKLSSSVAFSDVGGEAQVDFSADPGDPSNQVATVTVTIVGVGAVTIPVEIIGTTLETTIDNTSLQIPVGFANVTETLTVTAKDSGGQRIFNAPVAFTVTTTGTAVVTPSIPTGATNTRGEIAVVLTASGSGTATLTATGLGATASVALLVSDIAADNPFRITSPTVSPTAIVSGAGVVSINVAAAGIANVVFATSIGRWTSNALAADTAAVVGGVVSLTLQATTPGGNPASGFATVVVSDALNPAVFDSITIAMSPPITDANLLSIQSDVNVLPLSNGSSTFTANLEATVRTDDASGNVPIFNVPVVFTLANAPGGGEVLSKSFGVTDLFGIVKTQFSSGVLPSGQNAVTITAAVIPNAAVNDSIDVTIGGVGGSVALGISPFLELDDDNTAIYRLDMSAQVADSNGDAVAGSSVTLSMWPSHYRTGAWYDHDPDPNTEECVVYYSGPPFDNEDLDEDLILDLSSVLTIPPNQTEDANADGLLTPHNSTGGTVPPLVVTDPEGIGAYQLTYLKQYAKWIDVRARGRTKVQGTETTGNLFFNLEVARTEAENCDLPGSQSPFDLVLTGAPGVGLATIVATGSTWSIPPFEGNNNVVHGAGRGTIVTVVGIPPAADTYHYQVDAAAVSGTEYDDNVFISADPFACTIGASCGALSVAVKVHVIVP
ncbi:MAG: hypothetical protein GXP19_03640 [Gammaproteobacteria bacterium]|nr:hypothetical protein [Gammaproteobacteria bacterium]